MTRHLLIVALLGLFGHESAAFADDGKLEVGGALGGHAFSSNGELGVDDVMTDPGPVSSVAIGARAAYVVMPKLAVEGELILIPTKDDVAGDSAIAFGLRAHARYDLAHLMRGRLVPFALAGLGVHMLAPGSSIMLSDTDQAYHWGAGVRWALNDHIDLRADMRHLIVPDRTLDGATSDFEITAGVTYRLGVKHAPAPVLETPEPPAVAVAPPASTDADFDGVPDDQDRCKVEPEDVDSFEDSDGCPELDNDKDGIKDVDDTCPNDAETVNNFRDNDGCPDQIIGDLTGIGFESDSARIDKASAPLLDKAYALLVEYPGLSVEIAGHTSAEGGNDHNLNLSLTRAEAVKGELVKRGIAPARILTVGHGSDKPLAGNETEDGRRKNRRIEFRILTPDELPQ